MIKSVVKYIAVIFFFIGCNNTEHKIVVNGTALGVNNGDYVFLKSATNNSNQLTTIDSTLIKDGKFNFKIAKSELNLNFLQFGKNERVVPFVVENGVINILYNATDLKKNTIGGTFNNNKYQEYMSKANEYIENITQFEIENNPKLIQAQKEHNNTLLNAINLENKKLILGYEDFNKNFIESNKTSYVSLILLEQLTKKNIYSFSEGKNIFNSFSADIIHSQLGNQLNEFFNPESVLADTSIGAKFPDYVANNQNGQAVSIYTKLGSKLTLIDVWASWCPPCRMENPLLVKLHDDFNAEGFEIIGISLDKSKDSWERAISKDKLTWLQLSNLKEWKDPIVKRLGIEEIPANYLIDNQGKIVAKNLNSVELRKEIIKNLNIKKSN